MDTNEPSKTKQRKQKYIKLNRGNENEKLNKKHYLSTKENHEKTYHIGKPIKEGANTTNDNDITTVKHILGKTPLLAPRACSSKGGDKRW